MRRYCCWSAGVIRIICSLPVFSESFAKATFGFSNVLFFTFFTFNHISEIVKWDCLVLDVMIDDGRTTYTFSTTGETREIKQHITCKSNNLTYMIECKKCKKQYIGETKRSLRERFTEHRQATNNSDHASASAAVPTHFNLPSHSVKDMLLIPLELQVTNNPTRRKAREAYFIQRGQTLTPYGINRRNER